MKYVVLGESSGATMEQKAAEAFVQQDPFALEGLVKSYSIRGWNDALLG